MYLFDLINPCLFLFFRKKITELDKDKRVQIGVFGETGAGKSSLINAIIDEENLLPSSDECTSACTSVIIKVEASVDDKYQALIEFLKTEVESYVYCYLELIYMLIQEPHYDCKKTVCSCNKFYLIKPVLLLLLLYFRRGTMSCGICISQLEIKTMKKQLMMMMMMTLMITLRTNCQHCTEKNGKKIHLKT